MQVDKTVIVEHGEAQPCTFFCITSSIFFVHSLQCTLNLLTQVLLCHEEKKIYTSSMLQLSYTHIIILTCEVFGQPALHSC